MAGIKVQLVTTGIKKTLRRLKGISERAKDLRPVWPKVADDWARMNAVTFQRDGASPGWGRWKPISPEWAARKAREGFDSMILRRTGTLRNSLINRSDGNFLFRPTRTGVTLGTLVPYSGFHGEGREPVRQGKDAEKRWSEMIERYVSEGKV